MYTVELKSGTSQGKSRLNVVLPGLSQDMAFGGTSSALELTRHLLKYYDTCRFISLYEEEAGLQSPEGKDSLAHLKEYAAKWEIFFSTSARKLPCHEKDVFLVTYWPGASYWESLHKARLREGLPARPFYYFIQDYEPGFAPLGAKHALALRTYSFGDLTTAIINSRELAEYLKLRGDHFAREYVLKPSLNKFMAAYLSQNGFKLPPKRGPKIIILFYGRPGLPRNCFETGIETLRLFFAELPPASRAKFTALSVGLPHEDLLLQEGAVLKSLGRLPIDEYIALLLRSHVGLSLMISPHPSYPPLEMALFGLSTVTTDYSVKKMQGTHPLLLSAKWPEPRELAALLRQAVTNAAKLKDCGQRAVLPSSLSGADWAENFASLNIEPIQV